MAALTSEQSTKARSGSVVSDLRVDWQTMSLRLTVFPSRGSNFDLKSLLWANVMGEEPAQTVQQLGEGLVEESGPFENGLLRCIIRMHRIDWRWDTIPGPPMDSLRTLGDFESSAQAFSKVVHSFTKINLKASRIAFAGELVSTIKSRSFGYEALSKAVPFVQDVPGEPRDLLIQVNYRKESSSGIPNLQINRLCKWSIGAIELLTIRSGPEGMERVGASPSLDIFQLEFDINTAPEFKGIISRARGRKIFKEFVDEANGLARSGVTL